MKLKALLLVVCLMMGNCGGDRLRINRSDSTLVQNIKKYLNRDASCLNSAIDAQGNTFLHLAVLDDVGVHLDSFVDSTGHAIEVMEPVSLSD